MIYLMSGRIEDIATTVAALTRAAAAALWLGNGDDLTVAGTYPSSDAALVDGDLVLPLGSAERPIGQLVLIAPDRRFTEGERALLDIAASQIAGALERARLFQEVM